MEDYEVPIFTKEIEIEYPIYTKIDGKYQLDENGNKKIEWKKDKVVLKELDFDTINKIRSQSIQTKIVGNQVIQNPDTSKIMELVIKEAIVSCPFNKEMLGKMPKRTIDPILSIVEEMNFVDDKKKV